MAPNDGVVVGIDVSKDKVDASIRTLALRQTCPSTSQGRRQLAA
jgi:transposase